MGEVGVGHDLYERGRAEEAEALAAVAEAVAQRRRRAELEARWQAGTYRGMFGAARAKLAKAREEVKAVRHTAREALSRRAIPDPGRTATKIDGRAPLV